MTNQILCACTGKACEGLCKKMNLYRERKTLDRCPAAFELKKETKRKHIKEF